MNGAVIFDLDGTLWDSSKEVTESWNIVLSQYPESRNRLITVSDMHGFMGRQMDEIALMMMPDIDEKRRTEIMLRCMDYECEYLGECEKIPCYPELHKTLETLSQDYKLMIVSNCQDGYIQLFLKKSGTSKYFCDFESFGKTGLSKGENIKLVMARNNIEKAVYVGDTQGDLNSADSAGAEFIHAGYGFGKLNRETARISALSELPKICSLLLK